MALDPDKGQLLAAVTAKLDRGKRKGAAHLVRRLEESDQARTWFDYLMRFIPTGADSELEEYLRYALIGVCFGFAERELSPYLPEHQEIIPPLLEDIRSVYGQLRAGNHGYDAEEFRYRAYDYGLHKVTYLDWRLYLSKELY